MKLNQYITLGKSGLKGQPSLPRCHDLWRRLGMGKFGRNGSRDFSMHMWTKVATSLIPPNGYTNGKSEELVGKFAQPKESARSNRHCHQIHFRAAQPGNPNAGSNGRKNIYRALKVSLKRLGTDYIDLYWLHAWDMVTPVEEVLLTLNDLVKEGKIRYFGLSDVPAWYHAQKCRP